MYFGQSLPRREDNRFLRGKGVFTDDICFPDMPYMAFVRSPHSHASIKKVNTDQSKSVKGVIQSFSITDWRKDGMGELVCVHPMPFSNGAPMNEKLRPIFAEKKVCHVGAVVACVVAETRNEALNGAEAIEVEYESVEPVTSVEKSLDENVPIIHQ